jgi:hypothetical protein
MEINIEKEWVYLMMQAKQMGITIDEIRTFLRQSSLAEVSPIENKNEVSSPPTLDPLKH